MTGGNPAGQTHQSAPTDDANFQPSFSVNSLGSKILGTFKLPKFDGNARQWKTWDKTFVRYLSGHQLDFVLEESFLAILPLSTRDFGANKMVYYILEDAITPGSLAAKYLRQAAKWNGNEAYSKLHDGYVFSGPQTMALLLAELVNIRFKADESASGFCLRLREVFEDLEMVPGPSSIHMNDTQKIGYLLSGIRQEKTLQAVYVALQDKQVRGCVTFEEACEDLHHRCEAIRADDLLNTPVRGQTQKALISTHGKKQNKGKGADGTEVELALCLEKECLEMIKKYLPLCALHYHQCISGKSPEVVLKEQYGSAKFNSKTQKIDYPPTVPKDRFPLPVSARPRKGLMFLARPGTTDERGISTALPLDDPSFLLEGNRVLKPQEGTTQNPRDNVGDTALGVVPSVSPGATKAQSPPLVTERGDGVPANLLLLHVDQDARLISGGAVGVPLSSTIPGEISSAVAEMRMLACKTSTTTSTFYVDSGAGQCLSSCSNAFLTLEPCHIEVVGIAGSLPIFGIGTAVFALTLKGGTEILVRIHNCLYSFGEFSLLSVSQMRTIRRNLLDLSLHAPRIRLHSSVEDNGDNKKKFVDIPLEIDDGLYAIAMEPISSDDSRYLSSQIFDITPPGDYTPLNQKLGGHDGGTKSTRQMWTTMVLTVPPPIGKILTLAGSLDFHSELASFSDRFLAPAALPPSRRQFDVTNDTDMSELSIRFLGGGTDRIKHTVGISNGLSKPPSKKHTRVPPLNFPQGNMKAFKTPLVSKDIVGHVLTAEIAEALYTDTFFTGDRKFPCAQVFVDRVSRYGDVVPLRSRTGVGAALVTFVCRHYTPLVLISDNISENHGGDLVEQCRQRDIKQLFTCPYHPQMDFAEGYIGRITTMASFAMVYSGAPLFMWVWAVKTAVFVNNIMAAYYSIQKVWETPYELIHGELFPDASIVVPFGCGVLVLLPKADRAKFKSRCALMLFVHYAVDHPLYTYAVYSPMTKKVLMRQDCIFLPKLFPMRIARASTGMSQDGEPLVPFRSPIGIREGTDPNLSFGGWNETDPLPEYEDHVRGSRLTRPQDQELMDEAPETQTCRSREDDQGAPGYRPCHSSFGNKSGVIVMNPPRMGNMPHIVAEIDGGEMSQDSGQQVDSVPKVATTTPGSGQNHLITTGSFSRPSIQPLTFSEAFRTSNGPIDFRFLPRPPEDSRMFHSAGPRGNSFTINLTFTGLARDNQRYRVYQTMPVRVLHYRIALQLLRIDPRGIRIFVDDRVLFHRGTISDHFDPDHPALPTPYLVPNATAEIRLVPIGNFGPALLNPPVPPFADQDDGVDFSLLIDVDLPPTPTIDSDDCTSVGDDEMGEAVRHDGEEIAPTTQIADESESLTTSSSHPPRRTSSRVRDQRSGSVLDQSSPDHVSLPRRMVRDRWFYAPEVRLAQDPLISGIQGSSSIEDPIDPGNLLNPGQINQLVKRFNVEGRNRRAVLKARLKRAWDFRTNPVAATVTRHNITPATFTQGVTMTPYEAITGSPPPGGMDDTLLDVNQALDSFLSYKLGSGGIRGIDVFWDEFLALQLQKYDNELDANKRIFLDNLYSTVVEDTAPVTQVSDDLRQQRTIALWAGLRRVYFAEPDVEDWMGDFPPLEDPAPPFPKRKRLLRVPDDLHAPVPFSEPPDDPGDAPSGPTGALFPIHASDDQFEATIDTGRSNGEDEGVDDGEDGEHDLGHMSRENDSTTTIMSRWPTNTSQTDEMLENLIRATDKYEAAMAMQPEASNGEKDGGH